MWHKLHPADKERIVYQKRAREKRLGQFQVSKNPSSVIPGTDSVRACMLGQNTGPGASRLVGGHMYAPVSPTPFTE